MNFHVHLTIVNSSKNRAQTKRKPDWKNIICQGTHGVGIPAAGAELVIYEGSRALKLSEARNPPEV